MNIFCPNFWNKMLKFFNSKDLTNIASFEDFYVCGVPVLYFVNCEYVLYERTILFSYESQNQPPEVFYKKTGLKFFF